ncbi:MAG: response regulator [Chthoniobacter sp.]|nr:response regulator [Chthoniobacter sp.]
MNSIPTILIVEDDDGHAFLIVDNLRRAGITAPILRFSDGQEILDFLFCRTIEPSFQSGGAYLLSLDIRMPRVDGIEALRQIKTDSELRKLPVIMLTTTDDSREVERCHELGCNGYIQKPVSFDRFAATITKLGQFMSLLKLPRLSAAQQM